MVNSVILTFLHCILIRNAVKTDKGFFVLDLQSYLTKEFGIKTGKKADFCHIKFVIEIYMSKVNQ